MKTDEQRARSSDAAKAWHARNREYVQANGLTRYTLSEEDSVWLRVEKSEDCWEWRGAMFRNGYGRFDRRGPRRICMAHRLVYEYVKGPIPEGLDLDHLCRNRRCVNPDHLEPVTRRVNLMRGETLIRANAKKTHCRNGHAFTPENLSPEFPGRRVCLICRTANKKRTTKAYHEANREKRAVYMREWWRKRKAARPLDV
jgi:hypothetical protein